MSTIMTHALREKNKLLNRVRRVRGLLDAIERALDEEGMPRDAAPDCRGARRHQRPDGRSD